MRQKKEIRAEVSAKKKALSMKEVERMSLELKEQFCQLDAYKEAECIFAYMSYNEEVRTMPIIEQAWKDGKRVAVPKTYASGAKKNDKGVAIPDFMEFIYIRSMEDCTKGYMGIPEPKDEICGIDEAGDLDLSKAQVAEEKKVLLLMPGLAFDRSGNRIGYGGGFYDKYLHYHRDVAFTLVALCFDFQVYDRIPTKAHDEKMDLIIAPGEVIERKDS
ncbi:MAG: 5-formyltetrahydrofolate cyclo-ligase [Lachnospiraceae bacterium]|nr:5-formyltetrahydrofolate cyclo-ligase [Lachnospiraceae bacterium]